MNKIEKLIKEFCPDGVEWKKLGEVCNISTGKLNANVKVENGKYPFFTCNEIPSKIDTYSFDTTAILLSGNGSRIGHVNLYSGKFDAYQRTYVIEISEENIDIKFLYYFFKTFVKKYIDKNKTTGSIPYITLPILKDFKIPIPSIEAQEKIVKILDNFTKYVTELQAELQARNNQYNYYRDMLLSEDYLNKISEKLESQIKYEISCIELEKIIKIKNGKDWKSLGKGNIPVYGSGGKMGVFVDKYSYNKPTVLIPRKGSIENIFYLEEPFWNVDTIFYTEINEEKILPKYFYYFMQNYNIKSLSTDSTRPSITQSTLNKLKILLPPIEIQDKIVKILDRFQELLSDTKGLLPLEIEQRRKQYEYYREKLLTFDKEEGYALSTAQHSTAQQEITSKFFELLKEAAKIADIDINDKVEWKTLGEIGNFVNGSGMPKTMFDENGEIGAIHYGHIYTKYNMFVYNPIVKISDENSKKLKKVKIGDLVIAKTSENIEDIMKTVAYLGYNEAVAGGHSAIFSHNQNAKYLSYVFNGYSELIKQKNKMARGVKVIEISVTDMEKIKIPLPPLPVQEYIVSILDKFDALVNDLSQGLPKEIELRQKQYEYYREKLLNFEK